MQASLEVKRLFDYYFPVTLLVRFVWHVTADVVKPQYAYYDLPGPSPKALRCSGMFLRSVFCPTHWSMIDCSQMLRN